MPVLPVVAPILITRADMGLSPASTGRAGTEFSIRSGTFVVHRSRLASFYTRTDQPQPIDAIGPDLQSMLYLFPRWDESGGLAAAERALLA